MDEPPTLVHLLSISQRALARSRGASRCSIYTHDNPDPDALAAALGLQRLAEHELGVSVTLATAASSAARRTAPWSRT